MSYFERIIKSGEEKHSHQQALCITSTGNSALNSATVRYIVLRFVAGEHPMSSSEIRVPMPDYAFMPMRANASKILQKSFPELTSMRVETITEKLNDVDCTRPIKYKLWKRERRAIQDHPQHKLKWWRTLTHSHKH